MAKLPLGDGLLHAIFDSSPNGLWVTDLHGETRFANPQAQAVLDDDLARLSEHDRIRLVELRQRATAGQSGSVELTVSASDSPLDRRLSVHVSLVTQAGSAPALVHRIVDRTRERRLGAELVTSRQRLLEAQAASGISVWVWQVATSQLWVPHPDGDLSAPERGELRDLSAWLDRLLPDDAARLTSAIQHTEAGTEEAFDLEVLEVEPGPHRYLRIRGRLQRDANGGAESITGTALDITETRAAQAALQSEVARNRILHRVTSAAHASRTLAEATPAVREQLLAAGYLGFDAIPVVDGELAPTADLSGDDLSLASAALADPGCVWTEDLCRVGTACRLDDEPVAVTLITRSSPTLDVDSSSSYAVSFAMQMARVVERERVRAVLEQTRDDAMIASRHKSEFLSRVSHELRTPLNGIIGLNDLLIRTSLTNDQQRYASGVQAASRDLLGVVNDVLDFSRLEQGEVEVQRSDVELRPLLDEVISLLTLDAREAGVSLVHSCSGRVPAVVSSDLTRLRQVLVNLARNAVKFGAGREVIVRLDADGDHLMVEVSDEGAGLDPDVLPRLFEPFTQADGGNTRTHGGVGLGLAIVRRIVVALGGEVTHRTRDGGGAVFRATLPVVSPIPEPGELDAYARTWLSGRRSLVAASSTAALDALGEQLGWWDMRVSRHTGVDSALESLLTAVETGDPYEVVLIALHDADSLELAQRIADHGVLDELVMVVLSTGEVDVAALRTAGVSATLQRPCPASLVRGTLLEQVGGVVAQPLATVLARRGGGGRILVVEDNPVNQMVAAGLLESMGYEVSLAENGAVALDLVAKSTVDGPTFDALLMDVQMPVLDGYATTTTLRERGVRTPVIAMTASIIDGERERCLGAGMDDFLTKPVDPSALSSTLDKWLAPGRSAGGSSRDDAAGSTVGPTAGPTAGPASSPAVDGLDVERLDMLRDLEPGNTSYLDRAIANFTTNSEAALATMRTQLTEGDLVALKATAHKIAGSALNLGARTAGEAARAVELRGDTEEPAVLDTLLDVVDAEMSAARRLLDDYRQSYQ